MTEVVARTSKVTLLHFLIKQLESTRPDLLKAFDETSDLQAAVNAIGQIQVEHKALMKSLADLKTEVTEQQKVAAANPDAPSAKIVAALSVRICHFLSIPSCSCFFSM